MLGQVHSFEVKVLRSDYVGLGSFVSGETFTPRLCQVHLVGVHSFGTKLSCPSYVRIGSLFWNENFFSQVMLGQLHLVVVKLLHPN